LLSTLAFGVGSAILLAPIFIAVLRFIILAEVTQRYAFDIRDPRFQAFCGWSIAFVLVNELPISLVSGYTEGDLQVALWLTSRAAAFLFFPAVALVLPAVAVGARDVTLRNAFADIRGSYWRVVAIQALIYFPFLAATLVSNEVSETSTVRTAIYALVWFYSELVWTAATARMFLALANRLRSPAGR
jgi:hypothetical protein